MYLKRTLLAAMLLCAASSVEAKVTLPSLLSNNAVLQRNEEVLMWGQATPNRTVVVTPSWSGKKYKTKSDAKGEWKVEIATGDAGVGYSITFDDGDKTTIDNILLGEVWLVSGQSNMEMPVRGNHSQPVMGSADMIARAKASTPIRYFHVPHKASNSPITELDSQWQENTPEAIAPFSAAASFFAEYVQDVLGVPVGLVGAYWGATPIEAWMSEDMCSEVGGVNLSHVGTDKLPDQPHQKATCLYNAMLNPLLNLRFKGMLWYQGESNRSQPEAYKKLFPAFVNGLREKFDCGDFPFYYAEIAPFAYSGPNSAVMRDAMGELMGLVDNCGMVSLVDSGESKVIHPRYKKVVGERFAYWALGHAYGIKGIVYQSPQYKGIKVMAADEKQPARIGVGFWHAYNGLYFHSEQSSVNFEIAGADQKFYPAEVILTRRNDYQIEVWSDQVPEPVAVRYAYKNVVVGDVFGITGLPVPSFRSDNWAVK